MMAIFNSLKSVFGPTPKKLNRDLIQIINAERAGEEIPKKQRPPLKKPSRENEA